MRRCPILLAASAFSLCACKSLPIGSFELLNTEAMRVAKLTPDIVVEDAERAAFATDGLVAGMAISGGGMRASAFTLGVFAGLEEIGALEKIDFASSNSGGSWALAAALTNRAQSGRLLRDDGLAGYLGRFVELNRSSTKHWARAMETMLGPKVTMGQARQMRPRPFFNASLLPSQDPFVFVDDFSKKYDINGFYARSDRTVKQLSWSLDDVSLGFVAATSGSVPGFTHSYASTGLCSSGSPPPSFCKGGDGGWLRLVDGGLYDNGAYKTAWEAARSARSSLPIRHAVLLIDSKAGWPIPTAKRKDAGQHDGLIKAGGKLLFKGSFPNQEATYRRLAPKMFDSIGYAHVLLDFDAASGFRPEMADMVADLPDLLAMAADRIACLAHDGRLIKPRARRNPDDDPIMHLKARGGDCLANNLARVGYHHKTTYHFDCRYFAATYQLGVFVARRREVDVRRELGLPPPVVRPGRAIAPPVDCSRFERSYQRRLARIGRTAPYNTSAAAAALAQAHWKL